MKSEIVQIAPELARAWIERALTNQRKVRDSIVDQYAADMKSGNWVLTHQGIAFDSSGRLIDGQHRLNAIMKAGVIVPMLVTRDAPSTAFDHVDLGAGRSAADVFRIRDETWITNDHVAIAKFLEFGVQASVMGKRSVFDLRLIVEAHRSAIEFVLQNLDKRIKGITTAPVLSAIATAYYCEADRQKLSRFLQILVSGIAVDPEEDAVIIKHRDYLRDHGVQGYSSRAELFWRTQRIVKAYMHGERLMKHHTPSENVYPIKKRTELF